MRWTYIVALVCSLMNLLFLVSSIRERKRLRVAQREYLTWAVMLREAYVGYLTDWMNDHRASGDGCLVTRHTQGGNRTSSFPVGLGLSLWVSQKSPWGTSFSDGEEVFPERRS